jgi:hypothetical protein
MEISRISLYYATNNLTRKLKMNNDERFDFMSFILDRKIRNFDELTLEEHIIVNTELALKLYK